MVSLKAIRSAEMIVQLKGLGTEIYSHLVDMAQFSQVAQTVFKVLYFPREMSFCCVLKRKLPLSDKKQVTNEFVRVCSCENIKRGFSFLSTENQLCLIKKKNHGCKCRADKMQHKDSSLMYADITGIISPDNQAAFKLGSKFDNSSCLCFIV